jgi:hypothetical protein
MVCPRCEKNLVAGEVRDRDGTIFAIWQCPHLHQARPELKPADTPLWGKMRARLKSYWQKPVAC